MDFASCCVPPCWLFLFFSFLCPLTKSKACKRLLSDAPCPGALPLTPQSLSRTQVFLVYLPLSNPHPGPSSWTLQSAPPYPHDKKWNKQTKELKADCGFMLLAKRRPHSSQTATSTSMEFLGATIFLFQESML